ncbi:MAG: c-type cytochrome [Rhizobiaceae bacterium]|nr:c-type cytochrome [Hyphomicrobiales bacterium]NRB31661.1 c-type cytochrome [Rhizobiaceae bacterium]
MIKCVAAALASLMALSTPALAEGNIKAGKKIIKKCKACHDVKEGKNKVGPSLYNIVGATAGKVEGFKYSKAMAESGLVWDDANLRAFVTKPKELVPGNRMAFAGLKKEKQIDDLIAYLNSVSNQN